MKTPAEWLVPTFLSRFDDYLLTHYPVVWRTKAVFVLFYGLVGAVVLFAAGYFYPLDAQHLLVDPIRPIEMGYDNYHLYSVGLVLPALLYWAYRQHQLGFPFTKMEDALLTLVLYSLCFWLVFGVTTPAFRMGTIVHTAHWIDQADLDTLERSGIYPYGFVLLASDTNYTGTPDRAFFEKREEAFRNVVKTEDTLLNNRYNIDTSFWKKWCSRHALSYQPNRYVSSVLSVSSAPYPSYRSYMQDYSYLSVPSYISDRDYNSVRSFNANKLYLSKKNLITGSNVFLSALSDNLYLADRSYRSYLPYLADQSYISYRSYLFYRSKWSESLFPSLLNYQPDCLYYLDYVKPLNKSDLNKNIINRLGLLDTVKVFGVASSKKDKHIATLERPTLPHSIGDAVRSVKHAQLYLKEHVFIRHSDTVFQYLLLISLLMFLIPLLSARYVFVLIVICIAGAIGISFIPVPIQLLKNLRLSSNKYFGAVNFISYLLYPVLSCLYLLASVFVKKSLKSFMFAVNGLFVGLLCVLCGALFAIYRVKFNFKEIKNFIMPNDIAFYGILVFGLIGVLLIAKIRALPKSL